MPTQITKQEKKKAKTDKKPPKSSGRLKLYLLAIVTGSILGLSAPGIELWPIAWFGLAPLLLLSVSSAGIVEAFLHGLLFGTAYNLVYMNWYLGLQPLDWLGFNEWQGWALAVAAWLFVTILQGLIVATFSAVLRLLPLTGSFFPKKVQSQWKLPAFLIVPLLWTLLVNKILNTSDLLGVPWTMLEYSQYKQHWFIESASTIGGIGIGCLLVFVNVCVANLLATFAKLKNCKPLAAANKATAYYYALAVAAVVGANVIASLSVDKKLPQANCPVAVIQGSINIDMQKTRHRYTTDELLDRYKPLVEQNSGGLVVFTESAVPELLRRDDASLQRLTAMARSRNVDMVVGAIDRNEAGEPYNSAYGITSGGALLPVAYHKRYLVPFGEYTPALIEHAPDWVKKLTNTPAGGGFASGSSPGLLELGCGKVAPLICFECLSPELAVSSTRRGGELLVNVSDLAWFHKSIIGRQMLAFSVFRAIENRRYFVFAANTGPSAIIDPLGTITAKSPQETVTNLTGRVAFSSEKTLFASWFR